MKQKTHRLLSLLLCLVMVLGMLPMTAFAAEITNGNARVTAPVAGVTPSFTATSDDPSKYSVEVLKWIDVAHSQEITPVVLNDSNSPYYNYKFISGMEYEVVVEFTAVGDYTLSYDNTFTINGKATNWTGDGLKRYALFTAGSGATVPTIANQEVPVGTDVYIPWPEGATTYQRFEGSAQVGSGDRSGYPAGMYIPAQSTAATKTYKFSVRFSDGWIDSNEFTVTWTNSAHTVTVTGGTANPSSATVGTEITLTPSAAPSGLVFDKWEVVSGGVIVTDNKFTMPDTNVEIKATYKVSIENKEVPVGTDVYISWPEGATTYQLLEGAAEVWSGEKTGYPTGMYIPAQSTAATKTYKFSVQFSDGWIDSNEFTVTWKNATTYSATVADINISLPAGYGSSAINALGEQRAIKITNTGTETLNIGTPALSGTNADAFNIQSYGNCFVTPGSTNSSAYAVQPKTGLEPGTYTATISCTDADSKLAVPVTATVTLTVGEHHFDTSTWENNETHHWNPCTDTGCTAHGNEALHNSDTVKNAEAATFDTDGYTGDKHCSVCDRKMETGTAIAAGKYIRESKATMTPASITADQCANDLVFASLETSKYTVALHSVYDMTDTNLNTASGKYPTATKFVAGHQYRIVFKFTAVSPYAYDETHSTHCSTFTLNGAATNLAPFTSLAGSPNRMIELTAGASGITTYTVSFNANGGTGMMTDVTGVSGSYTLPGNDFTAPANKQFKGWATSATGTVISGNTINVTANTILYAIWEDIPVTEYIITVTDGKATVGAGTEISKAAEGTTVTLTANAAPTDKVFDKWEVVSGSITLADANSATTTFTMPASAVSVKATYKNAPHTHTYNQETVKPEALKTPADCTSNAVYFKSCSCGTISTTDTFVAMNTALGHAHGSDWKYDSTNHWHECSRCHDKKDEAAHDYGSDNVCDTCGYDKTVPHTHNLTLVAAKAATCTTAGNSAYYTCDGCDKWFEDATGSVEITDKTSVKIPAPGHTAGEWIVDTPATATTAGTKHKECTVCGYTMTTETIPATGGGYYYAPTAAVVPDMPMLYRGCTGDAVKTLQDKLNALGYNSGNVDGIFGAKTYAAVTAFQKANSLGVDGIVGKLTWGKLYGVSPAMPVETTTVVGRPMVSYGSRGDAVRKLQELLNALGYDCGSVDGIFGSKTKAAVLAFQKANGLAADGIVGPLTWGKLV